MSLQIREQHIHIIELAGRLDAYNLTTIQDFRSRLSEVGKQNYIVDLSRVVFLDSAWISALVSLLKFAKKTGGNVILVPPKNETARNIFTITRFDQVFIMADNIDEAIILL